MSDKIGKVDEQVNKRDLELILEINKKAIEIETEVADQNEEIIDGLTAVKHSQDGIEEKLDKLVKQGEDISRDLFKIQILFITGLLSIIAQIVTLFIKK